MDVLMSIQNVPLTIFLAVYIYENWVKELAPILPTSLNLGLVCFGWDNFDIFFGYPPPPLPPPLVWFVFVFIYCDDVSDKWTIDSCV